MPERVVRQTVDLSAYPDLVVLYLGMRVNAFRGIRTLLGFGPRIQASAGAGPDGLLLHESIIYSLLPLHLGMRQYWRDFDSLERWTRSDPHKEWWTTFLRDSGGTGFWHELYSIRGGFEAVYADVPAPIGLMKVGRVHEARGHMFSSRNRLAREGAPAVAAPLSESDLYSKDP